MARSLSLVPSSSLTIFRSPPRSFFLFLAFSFLAHPPIAFLSKPHSHISSFSFPFLFFTRSFFLFSVSPSLSFFPLLPSTSSLFAFSISDLSSSSFPSILVYQLPYPFFAQPRCENSQPSSINTQPSNLPHTPSFRSHSFPQLYFPYQFDPSQHGL